MRLGGMVYRCCARVGFDNIVAKMIEDFHKQLSLIVVVFDHQYFFISRHKMKMSIGSANLGTTNFGGIAWLFILIRGNLGPGCWPVPEK